MSRAAPPPGPATSAEALLVTRGLGRYFGGLCAVDEVDLCVQAGEIRALIGPNGAGKTTLVGMICGRVTPGAGSIEFHGEDITRLAAWRRVMRGIVYTFQVSSVFGALSCYQNVALAAQRRLMRGTRAHLALPESAVAERVDRALARVGLAAVRDQRADALPYGYRRLLEVAMALALEPTLLVLDEPTQGLAGDDIAIFTRLVRDIAAHATVLLIEHNMSVVLELATRITVMDRGAVLAEGSAAEIEANPAVQRAYLGG